MTTHEASSSSSPKSKLWNYDVFLSFSGVDTRNGFTGHLHAALTDRGYQAYIDEDDLERGEEIQKELEQAIEKSKIYIIVFSERYADSSWCLNELVKIMECRDKLGRHVLPIFYHVDPSHVRKQNGVLAQAFKKHEENISKEKDDKKREEKRERVKQWTEALREAAELAEEFQKHEEGIGEEKDDKKREAKQEGIKQWGEVLTKAANLSGYHLQITDNRREAKLIREIVDKIIPQWLSSAESLHVAKHPIGIYTRIQDIITYLSNGGSNVVRMVGIWGMGGLGKTTAAKAIYNKIHHEFQFKSFLDNVSEKDLVVSQKKLVSDILKQTKLEITSVDEGISLIKHHLQSRRVLVIIDNVDKVEQLNAIAGNRDWFGPGSGIIITTRDECLLKQVNMKVDQTYPLKEMNEEEALRLFSWHAFGNSCPNEGYLELSKEVVSYCGGLPLALEVLGSSMIERVPSEWKSQSEKLKKIPHEGIMKPLRVSFEKLDLTQKAIFLDISCFFIGWEKDYVAKVLDECEFFATIGISVLRERCLVTVERNVLYMHDLLREMARVIISEKSPGHPGKWSRLWNSREVINVLTNKSGTEEVEGLALDIPYPGLPSSDKTSFSTEAFANMKKLRLLQLNYANKLNGKYEHLPKELIWLCWHNFPLESIPDDFLNQEKLVAIKMYSSKLVQFWQGSKSLSLQKLKIIDLSFSSDLIKSPDFSQVPNLEELILEYCNKLSEIHPSIGYLKRLSLVNLRLCDNLIFLPTDFYKSKSVETLFLSFCSKFKKLHNDLGKMISLKVLDADSAAIKRVPPSIVRLNNLTRLDLSWCGLDDNEIPKDLGSLISLQNLSLRGSSFCSLPSLNDLSKLETLKLSECRNLHTIPNLPTSLTVLKAPGCPALKIMPNFSKMSSMRKLNVSDSPTLTEVPGLDKSLSSMTLIDMKRCTNLTANFKKNIIQGWTSCGFGGIFFYGNYVPGWFEFVNNGNKVSFDIPPSDVRNFKGLTLFCFYHSKNNYYSLHITVINHTKRTELRACIATRGEEIDDMPEPDYIWLGQLSNDKLNLQGGDKVDIIFEEPFVSVDPDYLFTVKRTGVNLVWDKPMEENMHPMNRAGYVSDPHPAWFYDEAEPSHESSDNSNPSNQMRITTHDRNGKRQKF